MRKKRVKSRMPRECPHPYPNQESSPVENPFRSPDRKGLMQR